MDIKMQQAREQFYSDLKRGGMPYGPDSQLSTLRAYAPVNEYARAQLRRMEQADLSLALSRETEQEISAERWGDAADATNVVGDVVTMGAHRDLQQAYDDIQQGQALKALKHTLMAGGKVVASAVLSKPGEALKELGVTAEVAQAGKVAAGSKAWPAFKNMVGNSRVGQALKPLAIGGWNKMHSVVSAGKKLIQTQAWPAVRNCVGNSRAGQMLNPKILGAWKGMTNFVQSGRAAKLLKTANDAREGHQTVGDWKNAAQKQRASHGIPSKTAIQRLQVHQLKNPTHHKLSDVR